MKIAMIGSGNIGKSIGAWAAKAGYDVTFTGKTKEHAEAAATAAGHDAAHAPLHRAIETAEMVVLAVPYKEVKDLLDDISPLLDGKIVVDVTNPLKADYTGLAVGFTTSAAEEIAKLAPRAKVVKAFNTVFASVYASQNPVLNGNKISIFVAGDDAAARQEVIDLAVNLGFDGVDAGPLTSARVIEPLAMLNIMLGYQQKLGTAIGFSLLR
jgi:NADPH-dependent F420 reductase